MRSFADQDESLVLHGSHDGIIISHRPAKRQSVFSDCRYKIAVYILPHEKPDPLAARRARIRYGCLDHFLDNPQSYGYAAEIGLADSCEQDIVAQLVELRTKAYAYMKMDGIVAEDEYFCAEQNAKVVMNAEEYYRSTFRGRPNSWNLRDKHMFLVIWINLDPRSSKCF